MDLTIFSFASHSYLLTAKSVDLSNIVPYCCFKCFSISFILVLFYLFPETGTLTFNLVSFPKGLHYNNCYYFLKMFKNQNVKLMLCIWSSIRHLILFLMIVYYKKIKSDGISGEVWKWFETYLKY